MSEFGHEVSELVERWIRPDIREISAYHVPPATGLIKLDAMENPYDWPAELREPLGSALAAAAINRYPDPAARELRSAMREQLALGEEFDLLLGNGSDELIEIMALACAGPDRTLLSVEPGFVMYRMIAGFAGMRYAGVPLRRDFSLDLQAVLEAMEETQAGLVFLAYPNNPTGNLFDREALIAIIRAAPGLVVIDEAYAPFTDQSFLAELGRYPNLLVMRTFSKMGLAGLRLGYLAGPREWLRQFDKVRLPYNINALTQAAALVTVRNPEPFRRQTREIRAERERLFDRLGTLRRLTPFPSQANFLLVRMPEGRAGEIFDGLKSKGVLVKRLDGSHPLLDDCLRLTVGTAVENDQLVQALSELV